jgi:hypothetical protein
VTTTKDELHQLVDELDEDAQAELLDYALWLTQPADTLTPDELALVEAGEAEIARGDYVSFMELRHKLDL